MTPTATSTALALPALLAASIALADSPAPDFLGQIIVPSGLSIAGVPFGGISDLSYDAATGHFHAISDDRADHGPARRYDLALTAGEDGVVTLDIVSMTELTDETGAAFAPRATDPEGIAWDGAGQRLFWSTERDAAGVPAIYVTAADGTTRRLTIPEAYTPDSDGTRGVFNNLAFEALALSADGSRLFVGTENGLAQDGDRATLEAGSPARILVIDTNSLEPVAEYVYPTEPIFEAASQEPFWNDNGLTAFETLPDGRLVAVERSYAHGVGNHIRVFTVSLDGADSILGQDDIAAAAPVTKTPWFEIGEGDHGLDIDNIESLSWGPEIGGRPIMVLASDDNFNAATQFTQFVVFTLPGDM
ncbi:esterase-like activity of phytase family protein [Marinibacterium sp. SX1]|uniref:esterase-like activity of phytase family protein n=1 Tax=Marinibacterium sp. SX1 TaxID=3388424 RepID=UPI003D17702C